MNSEEVIRGIQVSGIIFATDRDSADVGLIRIEAIDEYSELGFDCAHFDDAAPNAKGPGPIDKISRPLRSCGPRWRSADRIHRCPRNTGRRSACIISRAWTANRVPPFSAAADAWTSTWRPLERTWIKLPYQTAKVGEAPLVMPASLPGWKEGDKIIISGTTRQFGYIGTRYRKEGDDNSVADNPTTEERVITGMNRWGNFDSNLQIVRLDKPLEFDHLGDGEFRARSPTCPATSSSNRPTRPASAATRCTTPIRPAASATPSSATSARRTCSAGTPSTSTCSATRCAAAASSASPIWDSHNRWITIHGTNYLVVRDCVGYKSVGHGYFLEDGTEVYNVLDRNLAVQALGGKPLPKQVLPFDGIRITL